MQLTFYKLLFLPMRTGKYILNILSQLINIKLNLAKIWKEQAATSSSVNLLVIFFFFHIIFLVTVKYLPPNLFWCVLTAGCGNFWECLGTPFYRTSLQWNDVSVKARCMQVHLEKQAYSCVCLITHHWQSHCEIKRLEA